jgi:hypothetical protein
MHPFCASLKSGWDKPNHLYLLQSVRATGGNLNLQFT